MAASTDMGLAFLQGGAVLVVSAVIRGCCARNLTSDMVPEVLRARIRHCNRAAPFMLLAGLAVMATGVLLSVNSR